MGKSPTRKGGKKGNRRAANANRRERRGAKTKSYYASVLPGRKLRQVLRNNGLDAAKAYADEHGLTATLLKLIDK